MPSPTWLYAEQIPHNWIKSWSNIVAILFMNVQWRDNVRKKEVLRRIATKKKFTDQKEIAEILGTYY